MDRLTTQQHAPVPTERQAKGGSVAGPRHAELASMKAALNSGPTVQRLMSLPADLNARAEVQRAAIRSGLPHGLKTGVEALSGLSLDHVRVHRNSSKPAQLQAHAYTQGSEIHLAPGQEQHLPHEAWHVVQQVQGRVRPTTQLKGGVQVNNDRHLEREADVMGNKAVQLCGAPPQAQAAGFAEAAVHLPHTHSAIAQRAIDAGGLERIRAFKQSPDAQVIVDRQGIEYGVHEIGNDTVTLWDLGTNHLGETIPRADFLANFSIIRYAHGGISIPEADYTDHSAHHQVRNGSQVIDLSGHPIGFAHYSYDLVRPAAGGAAADTQRDNDHLTIENALSLFLLKLKTKESADDIEYFLNEKPNQTKAQINDELRINHSVCEIDNFNFRPLQQGRRPLTDTLDPNRALRNDRASRKLQPSDTVGVDEHLSLAHFMTYVSTALHQMQVPALVIAQIRQSVADEATTRMGFPLDELFLNRGQIKNIVQFALVMRNVVGLNWLGNPLPAPLLGLTKVRAYVDITEMDFEKLGARLRQRMPDVALEIENKITTDGIWRASSGEPNFATVSQFLADFYWPEIRTWILNPAPHAD